MLTAYGAASHGAFRPDNVIAHTASLTEERDAGKLAAAYKHQEDPGGMGASFWVPQN
jgi:hypothetical protein